ncbi:MAG: FmdB family zinc ribbon protein [Roseiflexaceae bacterium]
MPIYEYRCQGCQADASIRFSSIAQAAASAPVCPTCGGERLTRLVSNIAIARSGGTAGSTPSDSPQGLAQAMRAAAAGRDMGGDFREVAARLDKGESAAAVEASLRQRVGEKTQPH